MQKELVEELALKLMTDYDLIAQGWKFSFDRALVRMGLCNYRRKTISLSESITANAEEKSVRNTMLHEIAHALVGPGHGHKLVWKRKAQSIGCTAETVHHEVIIGHKYVAVCPFGHSFQRHRMSKGRKSCGKCSNVFDEKFVLTYKKIG